MMHASTIGQERRGSEQIPFSSASSRSRAVGEGSNPSTGRSMTLPSCSTAATAHPTGHGFGLLGRELLIAMCPISFVTGLHHIAVGCIDDGGGLPGFPGVPHESF